jgi:hypothetical protein
MQPMKRLTWLLPLFIFCPTVRAETTLNTDAVKKVVVFLYAPKPDGTDADVTKPQGTGFLVTVHKKGDIHQTYIVLVTARHMVDPYWAACSPEPQTPPDRRVYIRLNNKHYDSAKDGTGVSYLPVDLVKNGAKQYYVNDDITVDAAVVLLPWGDWVKMQEQYDFIPMPLSAFASADEIPKFKIGDSVASAGLVPGRSGEKRNYPFFKFGNISNIPDEPTQVVCRLVRVWFIAANLVSGNSGSPIFYAPPPLLASPVSRGVLVGVQSSSIGDPVFGAADIAGMTPVEDIFKIFEKHSPPDADLYRGDESKRKPEGEAP